MNKSGIIVGLDIGTTKICAIVGRKNEYGKIDILGLGKSTSEGVERGVVSNIDKTVRSIQRAVEEASHKSGVEIQNVYVGIAGQHIKSFSHQGSIVRRDGYDSEISKEDISRLIQDMYKVAMNPGEKIIHVIPQEYTVDQDTNIKDPVGMSGVRIEGNFHIITGKVTAVQNISKCVEKAGLNIDGMTLEPIGSAAAVLTDEEKEAGVALVDIGGGTTDIAIFQEGIIRHTAVIPLGGNIITEDIKTGCTVMKKQAEGLKTQFGNALAEFAPSNEIVSIPGIAGRDAKEISKKTLAKIIQARVEEIFEHVRYEIDSSGYRSQLIGGLVLTGGGAMLNNIQHLAELVTGLDTRIGIPGECLGKGSGNDIKSPIFATGIGLVLHAMNNTEIFIEPEHVESYDKPRPKSKATKAKSGGFFDKFIKIGKDWLNDNSIQDDF